MGKYGHSLHLPTRIPESLCLQGVFAEARIYWPPLGGSHDPPLEAPMTRRRQPQRMTAKETFDTGSHQQEASE